MSDEIADASAIQELVGQYGMIVAAVAAALLLYVVIRRVLRTGRRAAALWIGVAGTGGGVPGWVAVRSWLRTKGWMP